MQEHRGRLYFGREPRNGDAFAPSIDTVRRPFGIRQIDAWQYFGKFSAGAADQRALIASHPVFGKLAPDLPDGSFRANRDRS